MKLFVLGVALSSVIWLGVLFAHSRGLVTVFKAPEEPKIVEVPEALTDVDTETESPKKKKRMKKMRRSRRTAREPVQPDLGYEAGEGKVGDDLTAGVRDVSLENGGNQGEGQLTNGEIESAIDRRFNGIQRCLTLMPPDAPTTGRLVIGMNISGNGTVTRVNLSGPNAMIKGEPGACFRRIVSRMRFRQFSGPDMIVHYPTTFE
jgi:hypothetical protein